MDNVTPRRNGLLHVLFNRKHGIPSYKLLVKEDQVVSKTTQATAAALNYHRKHMVKALWLKVPKNLVVDLQKSMSK